MSDTITYIKLQGAPQEPGEYLVTYENMRELVHVYLRPESYHGGVKFSGYLAVSTWNGKSVDCYRGSWYKLQN